MREQFVVTVALVVFMVLLASLLSDVFDADMSRALASVAVGFTALNTAQLRMTHREPNETD